MFSNFFFFHYTSSAMYNKRKRNIFDENNMYLCYFPVREFLVFGKYFHMFLAVNVASVHCAIASRVRCRCLGRVGVAGGFDDAEEVSVTGRRRWWWW